MYPNNGGDDDDDDKDDDDWSSRWLAKDDDVLTVKDTDEAGDHHNNDDDDDDDDDNNSDILYLGVVWRLPVGHWIVNKSMELHRTYYGFCTLNSSRGTMPHHRANPSVPHLLTVRVTFI
jgi:hypothetical protein